MFKQTTLALLVCMVISHLGVIRVLDLESVILSEWIAIVLFGLWHIYVHGPKPKDDLVQRFLPLTHDVFDEETQTMVKERVYHQYWIVEREGEPTKVQINPKR